MATGNVWGTGTLGGNLAQAYLTKWLRHVSQPLMRLRQLCDVKEAIGKHRGDTFNWNKIANIGTAAGTATIAETSAMPDSNFTVTKGTCTVGEYGNSISFTRKLMEMSQHEVKQIVRTVLAQDMAKTIDKILWDKVAATQLIFSPLTGAHTGSIEIATGGTAASAAAATAGLSYLHVMNIVDAMKERNIPTFDGENYVCISHPTTFSKLRQGLVNVNQYTESGYTKLLNGEIGKFGGVRFVEQTNINKVTATNPGDGNGWAIFAGGEAVIEAISVPEEIILKEVTDYGRSHGLAWYLIAGWTLAWGLSGDDANARIGIWWPNATSPTSLDP